MRTISARARTTILGEVIAVVAIAFLSKKLLDTFFWRFSGPVSLIALLRVLTFYLRRREIGWSQMGMRSLKGRTQIFLLIPQAALAIVAILAIGVGAVAIGQALGLSFMAEIPSGVEDRWGDIVGNLPVYLLWLTIGILSGGFAEEMFFRGYLITRLNHAFGGSNIASILAIIIPAAIFGFGHFYYQGLRGLITTGMIGLVLGCLFLLFRRNLWPLIIAHASVDSLVFTAMFMQWDI